MKNVSRLRYKSEVNTLQLLLAHDIILDRLDIVVINGSIGSVSNRNPSVIHSFTIRGQHMSLSEEQVIKTLKGVEPGVITEHIVEVGGVWYPLKKAFSIVTGIDLLKFQTAQAMAVFEKLNFTTSRISAQRNE